MLPDNFDFAMLPEDKDKLTLKEVGMLSSTIEDIDYADIKGLSNEAVERLKNARPESIGQASRISGINSSSV